MPKCPHCKKGIDRLVVQRTEAGYVTIGASNTAIIEQSNIIEDKFYCPECGEEVISSTPDMVTGIPYLEIVEKFLNGTLCNGCTDQSGQCARLGNADCLCGKPV